MYVYGGENVKKLGIVLLLLAVTVGFSGISVVAAADGNVNGNSSQNGGFVGESYSGYYGYQNRGYIEEPYSGYYGNGYQNRGWNGYGEVTITKTVCINN